MTDLEIYTKLTSIFRSTLSDDGIVLGPETAPRDIPKWDSFRYVEIILQIEQVLDIRIRAREANSLRNISEIVDLIKGKQLAA